MSARRKVKKTNFRFCYMCKFAQEYHSPFVENSKDTQPVITCRYNAPRYADSPACSEHFERKNN